MQKYVSASGWGWTNYQIRASAWGGDMCNNTDISVSIGEPGGVVAQRGGYVSSIVYVRYINMRNNAIGNWIAVPLTYSWPTRQYRRTISMNDSTQALQVAIGSNVWIKQDASNWVPMTAVAWSVCQLRFTGRNNPGGCGAW